MPIVISRKTGEIISKPDYTQEQIDRAWEHVVKVWAAANADYLAAQAKEYTSEPRGE